MLARLSILLSLILSCWLAGCTSQPTTAATNGLRLRQDQITAIKGLFPTLTRGMPADAVREKLGSPAEIQPMKSPTGKSEVWVYYFEKSAGIEQIATGVRLVPGFANGLGASTPEVPEPVFRVMEKRSVITLSLLMFNDHLAAQKAKYEEAAKYQ